MAYDEVGDDDFEDVDSGGSGLSSMLYPTTTTPEAKSYARSILDQGMNAPDETGPILEGIADNAEAARQALIAARARLLGRSNIVNRGNKWLAMGAGFGAPATSLSQSLGNVSSKLYENNRKEAEDYDAATADLLKLDTGIAGASDPLLKAQMSLDALNKKNRATLMAQALRTLGANTSNGMGGAGSMSNYGKIAQDEGYVRGTAAFNNRVNTLREEDMAVRRASSGIDVEESDPELSSRLAAEYGVPVAPDIGPGLSTKERTARRQIEARNADTTLKGLNELAQAAYTDASDADRFIALNKVERTGPGRGRILALSDAAQEMDAISTRLSRQIRQPGEGTTSDFDAKQFAKAIFSRLNNYDTNVNLATAFKLRKQLIVDKQRFMNDYFSVNPNGTVAHATAQWNDYLNNNPIFSGEIVAGKGSVSKVPLNPNRLTYKEYFSQKGTLKKARGGVVKMADGGDVSVPEGMADSLIQGLSSEFGDELLAAGDADSLARRRERLRRFMATYPTLARMTAGVGSVPLAMIPGGSSSLPGMLMRGAASGAGTGIGGGEGFGDRMGSGVESGLMGAGTGLLGGLTSKYLTSGAITAKDKVFGDAITPAERRIAGAFERDKTTPADVLASLRSAYREKVPANIMDAAGPNTRALAATAVGKGTQTGEDFATDLADRQLAGRDRVNDIINTNVKPDKYLDKLDDLNTHLYNDSDPLYQAAYKNAPPIKYTDVSDILDNAYGRAALKEAVKRMKAEGIPISSSAVMGKGKGAAVNTLNLQTLDYVKRALGDVVNGSERSGFNDEGRIVRGLRKKLVDRLDTISPDYKAARAQYAGDLEVRDALKMGKEEFAGMTPEQVQRTIANMDFSSRDAFRTGVAQYLYTTVNGPSSDAANYAKKVIGSPDNAEKLAAMFEKPSEAALFKKALEREAEIFDTTKPVLAEAVRTRKSVAGSGNSILDSMSPSLHDMPNVGALSWVVRTLNLMRHQWPMKESTADNIIKILEKGDPKEASAALDRLEKAAVFMSKRKKLAGKAGVLGAAVAGAMARPSPLPQDVPPTEEEDHETN